MGDTKVLRFVDHTITQHPDGERTLTLNCVHPGCGFLVAPTVELDRAQLEAIKHTGRTGHAIFSRLLGDLAVVVRSK
ncbi:hypothetical protein ACPCAE_14785 [Streptomyces cinereoruber]|uniref:DUF7848 domain-containing protein n=1 Tax=Streptomyces cinereoruber TaxID=67260 RepID=UPI003C308F57